MSPRRKIVWHYGQNLTTPYQVNINSLTLKNIIRCHNYCRAIFPHVLSASTRQCFPIQSSGSTSIFIIKSATLAHLLSFDFPGQAKAISVNRYKLLTIAITYIEVQNLYFRKSTECSLFLVCKEFLIRLALQQHMAYHYALENER